MSLPFAGEQFFDVFKRYNEGVWPAQVALNAVALVIAAGAYRANARRSWRWARTALVLLAALWLWSGIVYFKTFFTSITNVGEVFGSLFVAEAGLLLLSAWPNVTIVPVTRPTSVWATVLVAYALLVYPLLGFAAGQRYPAAPTFGAPCPLVIFTFGILCLFATSIPRFAMAIPVLWAGIGSYAAFGFRVYEDFGLFASAVTAILVIHYAAGRRVARLAV